MNNSCEVAKWIQFAKDDYESAEILNTHHPPKNGIICYHCQQCAEKALKAFIISRDIFPEKTHDLRILRKTCEALDNAFAQFILATQVLSPYATIVRYPNELEISVIQTKTALEYAKLIFDFVLNKLNIEKSTLHDN